MLEALDAMRALELEEVVEQRHEEGFACFGPEDPLEDNVGLGVGEDGEHGPEALSPERAGRKRWSRKAKSRAADMLDLHFKKVGRVVYVAEDVLVE